MFSHHLKHQKSFLLSFSLENASTETRPGANETSSSKEARFHHPRPNEFMDFEKILILERQLRFFFVNQKLRFPVQRNYSSSLEELSESFRKNIKLWSPIRYCASMAPMDSKNTQRYANLHARGEPSTKVTARRACRNRLLSFPFLRDQTFAWSTNSHLHEYISPAIFHSTFFDKIEFSQEILPFCKTLPPTHISTANFLETKLSNQRN